MAAIAINNRSAILARIATGERLSSIGASYGISQPAITQALICDPEYEPARIAGYQAKMERAEDNLEVADTSCEVNKRIALLKSSQWDAERGMPHIWGAKPSVVLNLGQSLDALLDADNARMQGRVRGVVAARTGMDALREAAESQCPLDSNSPPEADNDA